MDINDGLRLSKSTTATINGDEITFHFVDGTDETYVLRDLIHALAEFASSECRPVRTLSTH